MVGLPAMIIMWAIIWDEDEYASPGVRNSGLSLLALLLAVIGVSIWALFRYSSLA